MIFKDALDAVRYARRGMVICSHPMGYIVVSNDDAVRLNMEILERIV